MRQDTVDQGRIGDMRCGGGFRKARVALRIGQNPWQRIQLQELWLSMRIKTYVDATPITTFQRQEGAAAEIGDKPSQVCGEFRGAAQDIERMLWSIPEPFRGIGVEGEHSGWQRCEADFHKWQYRDLRTIAQERHRKLSPR